MAIKPGRVLRSHCGTVAAAALASTVYRRNGWAVVVLPEVVR